MNITIEIIKKYYKDYLGTSRGKRAPISFTQNGDMLMVTIGAGTIHPLPVEGLRVRGLI